MPEEESDKRIIGGFGITAGGNIQISGVRGQLAIGEYITQTQISQADLKDLLDSLHNFQKGIPELDLSPEDQSIVNGELSAAIKEAKQEKPALSRIKARFVSAIRTVKEAGKSIKDISELYKAAEKIAPILGMGLQALL
jgi:hypothetical protein